MNISSPNSSEFCCYEKNRMSLSVVLNRMVIFRKTTPGNSSPTRISEKLVNFCCTVLQFSSLINSMIDQSDKNTETILSWFHAKMATSCIPNYRLMRYFFGPVGFDLRGVFCIIFIIWRRESVRCRSPREKTLHSGWWRLLGMDDQ